MFLNCFDSRRFSHNSFSEENQNLKHQKMDSLENGDFIEPPFLLKAINFVGLKNFLVDRFIFARKQSSYRVSQLGSQYKFDFSKAQFKQIPGYTQRVSVIDMEDHNIPIVHFQNDNNCSSSKCQDQTEPIDPKEKKIIKNTSERLTIIYSHGNSSDIEDSYNFVTSMAQIYECDFIIYDYTGYTNDMGQQVNFKPNQHKLSQKSISSDLKRVIEWSQIPHQQIVLWGFSLGCYPTLSVASQFSQINGVILQSPFASIYRLMSNEVPYQKKFRNDIFSNIELIEKVQSNILIMHSQDDQIIPYWHAESLLKRCEFMGKPKFLKLLELRKFGHNNLDQAFYAKKSNKLQEYLKTFIKRCMRDFEFVGNSQNSKIEEKNKSPSYKRQENNLKLPQVELKAQGSIIEEQSLQRRQGHKSKRKLSLSRVFVQSSRKTVSQSNKIAPVQGDSQETIDSSKQI